MLSKENLRLQAISYLFEISLIENSRSVRLPKKTNSQNNPADFRLYPISSQSLSLKIKNLQRCGKKETEKE